MPLNTWIVKNTNKNMPLYVSFKTRQILITSVKQEAGSNNLGMVTTADPWNWLIAYPMPGNVLSTSHTYTYIHTHHTYVRTLHIHTHVNTITNMYTYIHIYTYITHTYTYIHMHIHYTYINPSQKTIKQLECSWHPYSKEREMRHTMLTGLSGFYTQTLCEAHNKPRDR